MHRTDAKGRFVPIPIEQRFWDKVDKNGPIHPYNSSLGRCWLWTGRTTGRKDGNYGRIKKDGHQLQAHRVAWQITKGPIPKGKHLLHSCDNPLCVHPHHTYPGTPADNHRDMIDHGHSPKGERHGRATVTDKVAREIRKCFPVRKGKHGPGTPEERAQMAACLRKYKISYTVGRNIAIGNGWKHL